MVVCSSFSSNTDAEDALDPGEGSGNNWNNPENILIAHTNTDS